MASSFTGFGSALPSPQIRPTNNPRRTSHLTMAMAVTKRSPYEVLKVKETASSSEIKAAYRALAKRFHPDVDPTRKDGGSEFMEIRNAYATLTDQAAKAMHHDTNRRVGFGICRRWETDQCW